MTKPMKPSDLLNALIPRAGITIDEDLPYGPLPRQKLDIYRPEGAALLPTVVFFHGGAWQSGNKNFYLFAGVALARQGYAVAIPNYRLYPEAGFPDFLADCAQAVAWVRSNLALLGGDPARLFLMGHSAGAYNAVMLAMDTPYLAAAGTARDRIAGVIGLAGPYDFLPITGPDIRLVFAGGDCGPQTQPITFADGRAPPLLLASGAEDRVVLPRNSLALAARIRASGGLAETAIYPGLGHLGIAAALTKLFRGRAPVMRDTAAFIRSHRLAAAQP